MPVQTVVPTGIGTQNSWNSSSGNKVTDVNTNNGDTNYISRNTLVSQHYTFPAIPGDAEVVTAASVSVTARVDVTPGSISVYGGSVGGPQIALTTGYGNYGQALDSLVIATINGYHLGLGNVGGTANTRRCTYITRSVTYLQAGEFFVSIYNLVGPFLIGSYLLYRDFLRMVEYSKRWIGPSRIIHTHEEVAKAWQEYRDGRVKWPTGILLH